MALGVFLLSGCGHVIYKAPNHHGRPFDFSKPPCVPAGAPDSLPAGEVAVRYLGAGGLAMEWSGATLLTAPFFSHYGLSRLLLGRLSPDEEAIRDGLSGVPVSRIGAILAGHSHYDHLGDLPILVSRYTPQARLYVNDSGFNLLAPYGLQDRIVSLEHRLGEWIWLKDAEGRRQPVRFLAVRSEHAPHILGYHWRKGQMPQPLTKTWTKMPIRRLQAGTSLAFVIDLMSPDLREIRFRIYYQDAASPEGEGAPPEFTGADRHPFDLAVFCIASYNRARGAPGWLLAKLRPRHVLVAHYEDFFRHRRKPLRFVPLLTDRLANRYLTSVEASLRRDQVVARPPLGKVCGPSAPFWTVPLPGERLRFQADLSEPGASR